MAVVGNVNMVEIIHQDYEKNKRVMVILFIVFIILSYSIPVTILIADPMNIFGIILLIIFSLLIFFIAIHINYRYHISTIITKDSIILKSLKKKTIIPKDEIRYIEQTGYVRINTNDSKYTITSTDIDTQNKIILEFINSGFPVKSEGTIINNNQNEIKKRKVPYSKFVNKEHEKFYNRSKKIVIIGFILTSIPGFLLVLDTFTNINFFSHIGDDIFLYVCIILIAIGGITVIIGQKMFIFCIKPKNRKKWDNDI